MDIVERCIASATSDTCLEAVAAKEIIRLRKIEAAAAKVMQNTTWSGDGWYDDMVSLGCALEVEE